jgi:hypothetical protein
MRSSPAKCEIGSLIALAGNADGKSLFQDGGQENGAPERMKVGTGT